MQNTVVILGTGGTIAGVAPRRGERSQLPGGTAQRRGAGQGRARTARRAARDRAGGAGRQQGHDACDLADADAARAAPPAARRGAGHRRHAWHRHDGRDRLPACTACWRRTSRWCSPARCGRPVHASPTGPTTWWMPWRWRRNPARTACWWRWPARVHGAVDVRKAHAHRLDAFSSGDVGPLARFEDGAPAPIACLAVRRGDGCGRDRCRARQLAVGGDRHQPRRCRAPRSSMRWHVPAPRGWSSPPPATAPCTKPSNRACSAPRGRAWWCCAPRAAGDGAILDAPDVNGQPGGAVWPAAGALTPAKARVELMLRLMARQPSG